MVSLSNHAVSAVSAVKHFLTADQAPRTQNPNAPRMRCPTTEVHMTQRDAFLWSLLGVIALAIFAHAFLPRYEWRESRDPGAISIIVYDRWTGRMQRAVYDDQGSLNVMSVYVPF